MLEQDADFVVSGDHSSISLYMDRVHTMPSETLLEVLDRGAISLRDTIIAGNGKRYAATGDIVLVHDDRQDPPQNILETRKGRVPHGRAYVRVASESQHYNDLL